MKPAFKPRILDIAIFAAAAALVVFVSLSVLSSKGDSLYVNVTSDSGEWVEPLGSDAVIEAKGPLGTTTVHVEKNQAFVTDSPCSNKLCIAMGKIFSANQWIACLPNRVFVRIEGKNDGGGVDAAVY